MLEFLALEHLRERADVLSESFASAKPFPHLSFEGLLLDSKADSLAAAFPDLEWKGWGDRSHGHQYLKKSCRDSSQIPEPLSRVIFELNSGPFMGWLEKVTGIANLLPDPHLNGGGLHLTAPGGYLTPHTDFHTIEGRPLFRRLNLLLYLNPSWGRENQGYLELWDKARDTIAKQVCPSLGRCVIFQTDNDSVHGFSQPVQKEPRRSIALYYYTAEPADKFSGDETTYWKIDHQTPGSKVRLLAQKLLFAIANVASGIAWRSTAAARRLLK